MKKQTERIASEVVGTTLKFHFPNGVDAEGKPVFNTYQCDVSALPANIQQYAVIHGIKQKLVDSMAIGVATDDKGRIHRPTLADKFSAFVATANRLATGEWNEAREGPTGGLLYQAMARLFPDKWESAAAFSEWLDKQAESRKVKRSVVEESLRRAPKVAPMIETIRAEMGKATVDVDGMLDELDEE